MFIRCQASVFSFSVFSYCVLFGFYFVLGLFIAFGGYRVFLVLWSHVVIPFCTVSYRVALLVLALLRDVADFVYFQFCTGHVLLYRAVPYFIVVSFLWYCSVCFRLLWYHYSCVPVVVPFCTVSFVVASFAVC